MSSLEQLHASMRACGICYEAGHAIVPGAIMSGVISAEIMTIGQAPGITEVDAKRPFNASSGRRLFQWLGAAGWNETSFRANQYMTSVTKCFPGKQRNGKGDRVPSKAEQALCRPYLEREIELVQPRLIIPIGGLAIKLFYPKKMRLREMIGTGLFIPDTNATNDPFDVSSAQRFSTPPRLTSTAGRYIVPLPHPSGASLWPNQPANKALIAEAINLLSTIREQIIGKDEG